MKKMKIEKQLIFADQVKRVVSLNVSEHLTYRHETEGIRASGPLDIEGTYEGETGIEKFKETLEMDVLAPNNKLSGNSFSLSVNDFQGRADGDSIHVMITLDIEGVIDDQPQSLSSMPVVNEAVKPSTPVVASKTASSPLNPAFSEAKTREAASNQSSGGDIDDSAVVASEDQNETVKVNDLDDLFQDAESTYTSYRIIVAKPNDTYTAIAQRYEVDEGALRETNKNKDILAKTLVILPFA